MNELYDFVFTSEEAEVYELREKRTRLENEVEKLKRQAIRDKQQIEMLQEELRAAQHERTTSRSKSSASTTRSPLRSKNNAESFDTLLTTDEETSEYTPEVKKPLIKPQNPPGCCATCSIM
jgi:phage shock protein A